MDAIKFVKAYNRICDKYGRQNCCGCPLEEINCSLISGDCNCEMIVSTVEQWAKEHPTKTRQDKFMEFYPNISKDDLNVCTILPCYIDKNMYNEKNCRGQCNGCRYDYWMQEVE